MNTHEEINAHEEAEVHKKVDAFRHRIQMTKLDWVRTYIFTFTILPLRLIGLSVLLFIACLISLIALCGLSTTDLESKPLTGWRRSCKRIVSFLGRISFVIFGLSCSIKDGKLASSEVAPILVVAPHSTFIDGFIVFWCGISYIVSRMENRNIPFLGWLIQLQQAIFVSRKSDESRHKAVKTIIERCKSDLKWPQLIMFPEGTTSNGKALLPFKPGAFYPGKTVQPVLIRYPNRLDTLTWTWNQPHGVKSILWLTLTQFFFKASIEFLEPYHPSDEEIKEPFLFASNVRTLMAQALNVPLVDTKYEDICGKSNYAKKNS